MAFTPENFRESYTGVTILEVCTWQSTAKLIGDRSWLQDLASGQLHDSRLLYRVLYESATRLIVHSRFVGDL